ncbi:MAG: hypothetical protein MJ178_02950 [Treponemataceae bacterium]|nr:hypothetical protein [Treponemataceae bacterium]
MTFQKNEIISSTTLVRQFATYLSKLSEYSLQKIAVIRNNEMEAVMLPVAEYERLLEIEEKSRKKSVRDYFGTLSETEADAMEAAIRDCRKVDQNEW